MNGHNILEMPMAPTDSTIVEAGPMVWAHVVGEIPDGFITVDSNVGKLVLSQVLVLIRQGVIATAGGQAERTMEQTVQPVPADQLPTIDFRG